MRYLVQAKIRLLSLFIAIGLTWLQMLFVQVPGSLAVLSGSDSNGVTPEILLDQAFSLQSAGRGSEASNAFRKYYEKYPGQPYGEEALWQAAVISRDLAAGRGDADWSRVRELFRDFSISFPQSAHLAEAYFEVGNAYLQMGFYREALPYYGLVIRRFPQAQIVIQAMMAKARCLLMVDRADEAAALYEELGASLDSHFVEAGVAHRYFAEDAYHDALAIFLKIQRRNQDFHLLDPELLRVMGISYFRVGNEKQGCRSLQHYLNLVARSSFRHAVLFELAESYQRQGKNDLAAKWYDQALAASGDQGEVAVFSKFRLAQYEEEKTPSAARSNDLPYEAVLDTSVASDISQDARLDLIRRYWQRQQMAEVYDAGKIYLAHDGAKPAAKEVREKMCHVLADRFANLLKDGKYEDVYNDYQAEYLYIKGCERATVQIRAGQALEELFLYEQAAVIYFRAMAKDMTGEEKDDIYLRRARLYLVNKDVEAAQRLLKYLRRIYNGKNIIGEIFLLSGRLRQLQNRPDEALEFFRMAAERPALLSRRGIYAEDYLKALAGAGKVGEFDRQLSRFDQAGWLGKEKKQYWYGQAGDIHRQQKQLKAARKAYETALDIDLAQDDSQRQHIMLSLADVLTSLGRFSEAAGYYRQVMTGADKLLVAQARQRLRQHEINQLTGKLGQ